MPLSKSGIEQIKRLKLKKVDYIYTSPLKRCLQTAKILGKRIEISNDLIEIDFGEWEGLTITQMQRRHPRKFNMWLNNFADTKMPGGESVKAMIRRVERFWEYLRKRHNNGNILIATHGGPAKVIIMKALGLPIKNFWHFHIDTGGVSVIESFDGIPMVRGINLWGKLY